MNEHNAPFPDDPRVRLALQLDDATDLADRLLEADDVDTPAIAEILMRHLPAAMFVAMCNTLELCPVHVTDIAICRDDDVCSYVN